MSRNLVARITVAAIAIPAIIWIIYEGDWWLFGMVTLLAIAAMLEFLLAEGYRPHQLLFWLGLLPVGYVMYSLGQVLIRKGDKFDLITITYSSLAALIPLAGLLVLGMIFAVGHLSPGRLFEKYTRLVWGIAYVSLLYPVVLLIGQSHRMDGGAVVSGGNLLLFLFAVLWIGDTAAMAVGSKWGRHKLAPTVSPHKTVEGFVGGLLGAVLVGVVMMFWKFESTAWYYVLTLALGCSFFGQLGDLVESMWKRSLGIKDSSSIIPGHGGVLDRFDSLLFAAPFMYFFLPIMISQ